MSETLTPERETAALLEAHATGRVPADRVVRLRARLAELARDQRVPAALRLEAATTALDLDHTIEGADLPIDVDTGPKVVARRAEEFLGCNAVIELVEAGPGVPDLRVQAIEGYAVERVASGLNLARAALVFQEMRRA